VVASRARAQDRRRPRVLGQSSRLSHLRHNLATASLLAYSKFARSTQVLFRIGRRRQCLWTSCHSLELESCRPASTVRGEHTVDASGERGALDAHGRRPAAMARNEFGETARDLAAAKGYSSIVDALQAHEAAASLSGAAATPAGLSMGQAADLLAGYLESQGSSAAR
jgi:hypothetical protein